MKKTVSFILAVIMVVALSISISALAADKSTLTFSDVQEGSWYYDAVMEMTRRGIFAGMTEPVNGVGTFSPDSTMTRNQFIVTIVRYLYPDTQFTGENWYIGYVNQAIKDGILKANDFDDYNAPCSREEMAYLVMNAANHVGLEHGKADPSRIPDYNDISAKYRDSVRESFDAGIIAGTTTQGHFAPKSTMTRAQGATVLYRLITLKENETTSDNGEDKGNTDNQCETVQSQSDFSFSTLCMGSYMLDNNLFKFCPAYNGTVSSTYNVNDYINVMYDLETSKSLTGLDYENKYQADMNRAPITFKEGEEHVTPRPGDIVIRKSDGKAITITATILVYGGQKIGEILGLFQDVDIWTNTINEIYKRDYNVDCKYLDPGALETETRWGDHVAGQAQWKPTYIGVHDNRTDNTHFSQAFVYFIYGLTVGGEVHTTREWGSISTIVNGYYYNNNLTKENCPFYVVIKGSLQYVGGEK